jgi:hypothetical protein
MCVSLSGAIQLIVQAPPSASSTAVSKRSA